MGCYFNKMTVECQNLSHKNTDSNILNAIDSNIDFFFAFYLDLSWKLLLCSDFSPPASPLSILYPSLRSEGDLFGEQERVPVWDWNMAWMEEMEAKVRAHHPVRHSRSFDV